MQTVLCLCAILVSADRKLDYYCKAVFFDKVRLHNAYSSVMRCCLRWTSSTIFFTDTIECFQWCLILRNFLGIIICSVCLRSLHKQTLNYFNLEKNPSNTLFSLTLWIPLATCMNLYFELKISFTDINSTVLKSKITSNIFPRQIHG